MAYKFNPFIGTFDYYESGGGGGAAITVVANYSALPAPATVSGDFYWCSASQGTYWLPGSLGGTYYNKGLYYSNGTTWEYIEHPYNATQAEVNTGTNTDKFVTPATLTNSTQLQYLDATSSIQTQLDNRIRIIDETATDGTTITGVTTNEIAYSFEIPANTFTVGNNPQFFLRNLYTGSAGTKTTRFYLNSSNSISGASLIGTAGASPTNVVSVDISRSFSIKSSTITQVYTPTVSNFSIQASATSPIAEYNIDWTASVWIIVAIQLANGADSAVNSYFKLTS